MEDSKIVIFNRLITFEVGDFICNKEDNNNLSVLIEERKEDFCYFDIHRRSFGYVMKKNINDYYRLFEGRINIQINGTRGN